mgnify:CR=1 FL=1
MPAIITITDLNLPELDLFSRYSESQLYHINEPAPGIFIAESPNVIRRALNAGYEPVSVLIEDRQTDPWIPELFSDYPDLPVYTAAASLLTNLTGFALTRGLLCAMKRKPMPSVDAVLLSSGCSDPFYRRAARVSMGTVFQIPWTYFPKEADLSAGGLTHLKAMGYKTAAMALKEDSVSIDDPGLLSEEKLAVILGTEGDGLASATIDGCDYTVMIPMAHGVDSLNVAAASAVAFWELSRH